MFCRLVQTELTNVHKILLKAVTDKPIIICREKPIKTSRGSALLIKNDLIKIEKHNSICWKNGDIYVGKKLLPNNLSLKTRLTIYHNFYQSNNKICCHYCQRELTPEEVSVDHYIPQSRGGIDHVENLKTSCSKCNRIKRSLHPHKEKKVYKKLLQFVKLPRYQRLTVKQACNQFAAFVIEDPNISIKNLCQFFHYLGYVSVENRLKFFMKILEFEKKEIKRASQKYISLEYSLKSLKEINHNSEWKSKENYLKFNRISELFDVI